LEDDNDKVTDKKNKFHLNSSTSSGLACSSAGTFPYFAINVDFDPFNDAYDKGLLVEAMNGYKYCGAYDLTCEPGNTRGYKRPKVFVIDGGKERRYESTAVFDAVLVNGKKDNIYFHSLYQYK
jgi:hypothetical protein